MSYIPDDPALLSARECIFPMVEMDAAADLCLANITYGMAKIRFAQEACGLPPDASFIGTPDMTITRNSARWRAGIGYGGKLSWGDGARDLLILDIKPNTCGMFVGGLQELPDAEVITARLHGMRTRRIQVDGIPVEWDFGTGNHFVEVFQTASDSVRRDLPPYMVVLHASGAELRGETAYTPGLYWDESPTWQQRSNLLQTPWGPLHLLTGKDVDDYMDNYWRTDQFARDRRAMAAHELFGDLSIISNQNHQGMLNRNEIILGCQATCVPGEDLLPIMVRADRPAFLMQGLPNLSDAQIDAFGFREAAEKIGILDRLQNANVIPHGAGYSLPNLSKVRRVFEVNGTRYFELERPDQSDTQIIAEPKDLTHSYRDEQVVYRTVECGLGTIAAKLEPLFALKT